jgi:phage shock protein C
MTNGMWHHFPTLSPKLVPNPNISAHPNQQTAEIRLWHDPCSVISMSNLTAMPKDETMTNTTPLPLRHDTILGVCEAIGRDFGFNPIWLRLAFIAPIFIAPMAAIAAYLGLGLVVALTNWFVADQQNEAPHLVNAEASVESEELAIAA